MFGALRRCPATLSRNFRAAATPSRALQVSSLRAVSALRIPSTRIASATTAGFHHRAKWQQIAAAQAEAEQPIVEDGLITEFQELSARGLVHPNIINVITKSMRITTMTDVQTRTINEALSGADV
jgi:ATP-dependent RNA helicase MSS116